MAAASVDAVAADGVSSPRTARADRGHAGRGRRGIHRGAERFRRLDANARRRRARAPLRRAGWIRACRIRSRDVAQALATVPDVAHAEYWVEAGAMLGDTRVSLIGPDVNSKLLDAAADRRTMAATLATTARSSSIRQSPICTLETISFCASTAARSAGASSAS